MNVEEELSAILNFCDKDQLDKYLNDADATDTLLKSLNSYRMLENEKVTLEDLNRRLAESNLNKKPLIETKREELMNQIKAFDEAKSEYAIIKEKYDAYMATSGNETSLPALYNQLHTSAMREEELTDREADEFFCTMNTLRTDEELNIFQKKFIEDRTQAHLKKIKAEKMKELLPKF